MNNVEEIAAKNEKIRLVFESKRAAWILREMMLRCCAFVFVKIEKTNARSRNARTDKISKKDKALKCTELFYRSVVELEHVRCSQSVLEKVQARPVYGSKTIPFLCGRERMRKFDQTLDEIE